MLDCGDFLEKPTIRWKRRHKNPRWLAPKERTEAGAQRGLVSHAGLFMGARVSSLSLNAYVTNQQLRKNVLTG